MSLLILYNQASGVTHIIGAAQMSVTGALIIVPRFAAIQIAQMTLSLKALIIYNVKRLDAAVLTFSGQPFAVVASIIIEVLYKTRRYLRR